MLTCEHSGWIIEEGEKTNMSLMQIFGFVGIGVVLFLLGYYCRDKIERGVKRND